jgi:hypothetical protein
MKKNVRNLLVSIIIGIKADDPTMAAIWQQKETYWRHQRHPKVDQRQFPTIIKKLHNNKRWYFALKRCTTIIKK